MMVILFSILISLWAFGLYSIVHIEEFNKKLQIHEKLIDSLNGKMDEHNF